MDFLKSLSHKDLLEEIEAVVGIEIERKARMMEKLNSLESLVSNLTEELTKVKVAFADREVDRFYNKPTHPPTLQVSNSATSYANAAKKSIRQAKPPTSVLCIKTAPGVPLSEINVQYVDKLLDFQKDGLMVKSIKPSAGKVLLNFKDDLDREKAVRLIESKKITESCIESVYVPSVTYPVLVKIANVTDSAYQSLDMTDPTSRTKIEDCLLAKIIEDNSSLAEHLVALRVLHSKHNPSNNTMFYLVRLSTRTATARDDLISLGKILFENLAHRVSLPNANKEIRRCLLCQRYGHSSKFCNAKSPTCGHCAGDHRMDACSSINKLPCCAVCKSTHQAGHHSCAQQQAAVKAYKQRMKLQ